MNVWRAMEGARRRALKAGFEPRLSMAKNTSCPACQHAGRAGNLFGQLVRQFGVELPTSFMSEPMHGPVIPLRPSRRKN